MPLEPLDCTKDFHMDVLFGVQLFPGGGRVEFNNSKKELEGFSKFLPVGLDLKFPGLEYILYSSLTLLLPQEWEEATWMKKAPFSWGQCGTHHTVTCHFEILLSQECGEGLQKPGW